MDDNSANIDLVFRNGLKDYEVLPPGEVWSKIRPGIRKKQRPLYILRIAAAAAVLLSLGFLVYRYGARLKTVPDPEVMTQAAEPEIPVLRPLRNREARQENRVRQAEIQLIAKAYEPQVRDLPVEIMLNDPENIPDTAFRWGSEIISLSDRDIRKPGLPELFRSEIENFTNEDPATLFKPVTEVRERSDKWTIAALVSPTYYTSFYSGSDEITSRIMDNEHPVFSYSGGLAFAYRINKRVSVQSGLYYSSFGHELSGISAFSGFQPYDYTKGDRNFEVRTTTGRVYTNNADVFLVDSRSDERITTMYTVDYFDPAKAELQYLDNSLRQSFSYLELPVIFRYKLIDKNIDFNLVGGLSSNILVNNSVYTSDNGSRYQVGRTEGMNLLTFSSSLGMGMEYNFSGNLSLNLEPTFRYYLNPFNQTTGLNIHPYSFGIFSGISYRF